MGVVDNIRDACEELGQADLSGIKLETAEPGLLDVRTGDFDAHVAMQPGAMVYYGSLLKEAAQSYALHAQQHTEDVSGGESDMDSIVSSSSSSLSNPSAAASTSSWPSVGNTAFLDASSLTGDDLGMLPTEVGSFTSLPPAATSQRSLISSVSSSLISSLPFRSSSRKPTSATHVSLAHSSPPSTSGR